ncbi:RNA polymerase sigma factor [Natronoflexus pectinivorans]|uniref:RNA polymerase sigma-70 factor (ECF subfamily) n=1 Tax=Natronoflexus pectinivorans TaxID=682526 RepID=A0A4R2GIG8_9BACT|nr:RNA polymerase sigma factor [Natronoflexus pectinivorans]TCO08369.1 RNA polymerase sigma-70 factor (ECF subfamily) [Natronoflexus pectinivorans]
MTEAQYNQCVEQHADNLYRFVLKNIKDEDKAADIVQDAYEKMWRNKDGVNPQKSKSYLFTTAYHVLIDYVRREKPTKSIENEISEYCTHAQYSDLNELLHQAVEKLPPDQKMVVMLRDYEGYSYEEIEQITGLSQSQVKVYIYRARLFLRKFIGKMEAVI